MIPDHVAILNERLKLLAGFLDAIGLALPGRGALAPLVASLGNGTAAGPGTPLRPAFVAAAPAFHLAAHYILGHSKKAEPHDSP